MFPTLSQCRPRMLNLLASIVAEQEVVVTITSRLSTAGVVAFEQRNIMLRPECGLFDLCLAARLMQHRSEARVARAGAEICIPSSVRHRWMFAANRSLRADYPQIKQLPGQFRLGRTQTWPHFTWSRIEFEPLAGLGG